MAPWPEPRLALGAETLTTTDRRSVKFTVTNGKHAGTAVLDPGDGSGRSFDIPIDAAGTGTLTIQYNDPGHHVYTASVTFPQTALYATWTALEAASATWSLVPDAFTPWSSATLTSETATTEVTVDIGEATIDAVVIPDQPLPYVQIDCWIGDPETVTSWSISREAPDAPPESSVVVWIGTTSSGGITVIDNETPLGQSVRYRLDITRTGGVQTFFYSAYVRIDGTRGCFLTDTASGQTVAVEVQAWPNRKRNPRQAVLEVLNRADPIVISDVHTWPAGTWTFLTRNEADLDRTMNVLLAGRLVLLRTQPGSSLRTTYAAVGAVDEGRLYPGDGSSWYRLTSVDIQEIAPIPATARYLNVSWQQVADTWPTWTALAAAMPTWLDVGRWNPDAPTQVL